MENYSRELYEKMIDKSEKLKEKWYNVLKA